MKMPEIIHIDTERWGNTPLSEKKEGDEILVSFGDQRKRHHEYIITTTFKGKLYLKKKT